MLFFRVKRKLLNILSLVTQYMGVGVRNPGQSKVDETPLFDKAGWGKVVAVEASGDTTEYHDFIDPNKLSALSKYNAIPSNQRRTTTEKNVNAQFFEAYGPNFENKTFQHVSVDLPWHYSHLLKSLKAIPNLTFKTCRETITSRPKGDEILCTVRHDVDGDIVAALQQAQIENELGIKTSFYLLHNAPYYGEVTETGSQKNDNITTFMRHQSSLDTYLAIQGLGHELALHTDGMDYYQRLNTDGREVLETEIKWLRDNGCRIYGTTAHNSFSIYGCNNYSIFTNRPLNMSTTSGPKAVTHKGRWSPLQVIDEQDLELEYEANDLFWQEETPLLYACLMSQNNWYIVENQYALLARNESKEFPPTSFCYGTHDELIDKIRNTKGPAIVKLVVHPMHYGLRGLSSEIPWLPGEAHDSKIKNVRYWAGAGEDGNIEGATITYLNEFLTPDRGLHNYVSGDFCVAVFGSSNVLSHSVNVDSKYPQVLARYLKASNCTAISSGDLDFNIQLFAKNLSQICDASIPDVIIIHPDSNESTSSSFFQWLDELCSKYSSIVCLFEGSENDINDYFSILIEKHSNFHLLNPTEKFLNYQGSAKLTWANTKNWTGQAHTLVGRMIADYLVEMLEDEKIHN